MKYNCCKKNSKAEKTFNIVVNILSQIHANSTEFQPSDGPGNHIMFPCKYFENIQFIHIHFSLSLPDTILLTFTAVSFFLQSNLTT
jgi:hypothetical protein